MRVLVACEFSGTVRDAFRKRGHDAWSCDLLPCESDPAWHLTGDVRRFLDSAPNDKPWDLMIGHPPCTYLSVSGMHWTKRGLRDPRLTEDALQFVRDLMAAPIPRIAIENPVSIISSRIRKPDQIIQPWQFGHDASKSTCLWLKGLPRIKHTKIVPPKGWKLVKFAADLLGGDSDCAWCDDCGAEFAECDCFGPTQDGVEYAERAGYLFGRPTNGPERMVWGNQTPSGQNKLGPSKMRWAERSKTFQGIADAMASQWGGEQGALAYA